MRVHAESTSSPRPKGRAGLVFLFAALAAANSGACGSRGARGPKVVRLADEFSRLEVAGRSDAPARKDGSRTEWRFDGEPRDGSETDGAEAGPGVADLLARDGALRGRSTTDFPVVRVETASRPDARDVVHSVEIRIAVTAGANLSVSFEGGEKVNFEEVLERARSSRWRLSTPIVPGGERKTYSILPPSTVAARDVRHVLVRPTDAAGAAFEIESIRVVFRKEHLASIPSGVSWQGLSEVYRETIVSRSPEAIRATLALPARPWLDLAIGTVEDHPVTFRVKARRKAGSEAERLLLERTITTPYRWEPAPVDLAAFAGDETVLVLEIAAELPGALGFWGAPAVRDRVAPGRGEAAAAAPRGVVFVMIDTLRRDHLDAYGYARDTAPHLRALASEGALFRDCFAQATWTKVSTPSILSSLHPLTHGVRDMMDRLPASATTIAEVFRDAGHATVSYSSVSFSGQFTNLHQGFEELHERGSIADSGVRSKTAREYVDRLLPWLEAHRDVPFFVFLHVFDPHSPFEPRSPWDALWADPAARDEHERSKKEIEKHIEDPAMKRMGMPTREEIVKAGFNPDAVMRHDRDWYDGSIRGLDAELGRLVERLISLGLDRTTLLVVTADHGEEFLEHGRTFHGQSAYGELSQVPLVFHLPGTVPSGTVVDETVQSIDIMPTVLEWCGLRSPAEAQGQSLVPLVSPGGAPARSFKPRPAVTEKAARVSTTETPRDIDRLEQYAFVAGRYKLVHNVSSANGRAEFELYDRRIDPLDLADLAANHPDVVRRMAAELAAWREAAASSRLPADSEAASALSEEELNRLRSLGYIR